MAAYNGEKYIEEQIETIINQTYVNWRLLIRDDASTDGTVEIIEKWQKKDTRIQVLKDEKGNLGLVKNFEELLLNSTADFIMFADHDDIWFPNKVELTIFAMQKKNQAIPGLVFTNSTVIRENISVKQGNLYRWNVQPKLEFFLFSNAGYQGSTSMINQALKNVCLPFPNECPVHDYHISFCALLFGEVTYIPQSTMYYRKHSNSATVLRRGLLIKLKSVFHKDAILFNSRLVSSLKYYIKAVKCKIDDNKQQILEDYFDIIDPSTSKIKAMQIVIKRHFVTNGSCIYLLFKILFLKGSI